MEVNEADRLVLLLRSLPTPCAEFVLLHSAQENYSMARQTAIRYETQRRLYLDWNSFGQKPGKLLHGVNKTEVYDMAASGGEQPGGDDAYVEAIAGRCSKCGSKRHETSSCSVDLSRTKCFKCGVTGHVSMNCTKNGSSASSAQKGASSAGSKGAGNSKGSTGAKGKGGKPSKGKGKDKGKAKGKSGKGKMFEVSQDSATAEDWWFQDESGYWWAATAEWSEVTTAGQEPEQEGSPATGTEQGTGQPMAATLIAGLFSCATVGAFASNNNLFVSNQTETMGMKHMSFSDLCSHDMFPICFKARGDRSVVTEGFQQLSEVVVTCDEAWEKSHMRRDWNSLDLGAWDVAYVSEMFFQECFAVGFHEKGCKHVHEEGCKHVHETRAEQTCKHVHETRVGQTCKTRDSRSNGTSVEKKRKRRRKTDVSRQVEQANLEFESCSVSDGAHSCHETCNLGMSLDLSFASGGFIATEWSLEEQVMHEFPGLKCQSVDDLGGPGPAWDWTPLMCGVNWISTWFAGKMLPMFFMLFLCLFFCCGVVESYKDPTPCCRDLKGVLHPISSQVQRSETGFWLLDSGAAATVVSQETFMKFKAAGRSTELRPSAQSFYAANGSPVVVQGEVKLTGFVLASCQGMTQPVSLEVTAVVGATQHDILSTNQCVAKGWTFSFSKHANSMLHEETGLQVDQVTTWGGCPWIAFSPTVSELCALLSESAPQFQVSASVSGVSAQMKSDMSPINSNMTMVGQDTEIAVGAVQAGKLTEAEMTSHRLRGHVPFAAWCSHCVKAKGIKQHRRRSQDDRLQIALAADFLFIGDFKVLALHERSTSSIGAIVMTSDVSRDRNVFCKWLQEMGVSSVGGVSIQLTTDAEPAVASFITGASQGHQWMVEWSSPQNHDFIGAAERTVRTIKEGLALIQSELAEQNLSLSLTVHSLSDVLRHICHSQNLFSHAHGSDRTPKELATGSKLREPTFAPFLAKVLAEIPDSIKEKYPMASRFVDAVYLTPVWSSVGCEVIGELYSHGEIRYVRFHAKSIKHIMPITWSPKFYQDLRPLVAKEHEHGRSIEPASEQVLPSSKPSLQCPASGPPVEWIRGGGGYTDDCIACRGLREKGTRKGLVHSRPCCMRYEAYLKSQATGVGGEIVQPPSEPGGSGVIDEPLEPSVEDGVQPEARPSVRFDDDNQSLEYEPTEGFAVEREQDLGSDAEESMRRDKRLNLDDYGDVSERPVKRRFYGKSPDLEGAFPAPASKATPRGAALKRPADMNLQELEDEIKKDDISAVQCESQHWVFPFMSLCSVVSQPPSLSCVSETEAVSSVRFGPSGSVPESTVVEMGGMPIKIWCPVDAVDDTTGEILDGKKCHLGMKKLRVLKNAKLEIVTRLLSLRN